MKASLLLITVCCIMLSAPSPAQNSVYPAGGQVGTSFEVKIPGVGASQWVWFDTDLLSGEVKAESDGDGDDWIKSIEAKTIYTFDEAGEYIVQLRDLTSRRGGPRCAYQLLVRPQIPHVGETVFTVFGGRDARYKDDRINIHNGGRNKMVIVTELEEGFDEEIILEVENLPPGVRVLPLVAETNDVSFTGQVYEFRGTSHKERYRPPRRAESVMFMADQDAPNTFTLPHMSRLVARPLFKNAPGGPIICQEIPVKVVIP